MKYMILVLFAGALASCNAPTDPAANSSSAPADQYFYPPTNGMRYIYAQDGTTQTSTDTSTYQVVVGSTYDSYAKLIQQNVSGNNTGVLYYYKVDANQAGVKCILSATGSDHGIIALEGSLDVGSTWTADDAGHIQATVVGKYAEYFLPGRQLMYHDAVAVQYVDNMQPAGTYTLRIFALDYGLIYEEHVTSASSSSSSLQLLDRLSIGNSSGAPDNRDHWYDLRGRYAVGLDPNWERK